MNEIKTISLPLNNITSGSNNKIDFYSIEIKNYKKKINNFFYEIYYFQGIADLIFARVYYKKYLELKNENSTILNNSIKYYLNSLKILNNSLDQKNIFIANINLEIGRLFSNQNIDVLKSIPFYTNSYKIYQEHKEDLWEIFKIVLIDLCKLNSKMGFLQISLNYGIEYLNEYDKYERVEGPKKYTEEYRELAYNCLIISEHLNKNNEGIEVCKKIFERSIFTKNDDVPINSKEKIENYKDSVFDDELNKIQFMSKYIKFIVKDFTDERLKNYYDWVYFYKNIFEEDGKFEIKFNNNQRIDHIIHSIENGDIKDFKIYFLNLINHFNSYISNSQGLNGNFEILKSETDDKFRNLKYLYATFKDDIFN